MKSLFDKRAGGLDGRLLALLLPFCLALSYSYHHRFDRVGRGEADLKRLDRQIDAETKAIGEDRLMLQRLTGERRAKLEAVIAGEEQRRDAWRRQRHDLEVTIREWKAQQRAAEGRQP